MYFDFFQVRDKTLRQHFDFRLKIADETRIPYKCGILISSQQLSQDWKIGNVP